MQECIAKESHQSMFVSKISKFFMYCIMKILHLNLIKFIMKLIEFKAYKIIVIIILLNAPLPIL